MLAFRAVLFFAIVGVCYGCDGHSMESCNTHPLCEWVASEAGGLCREKAVEAGPTTDLSCTDLFEVVRCTTHPAQCVWDAAAERCRPASVRSAADVSVDTESSSSDEGSSVSRLRHLLYVLLAIGVTLLIGVIVCAVWLHRRNEDADEELDGDSKGDEEDDVVLNVPYHLHEDTASSVSRSSGRGVQASENHHSIDFNHTRTLRLAPIKCR